MTHLTPVKRQILTALRDHQHLESDDVARVIGSDELFRVRAELHDLCRPRWGPLVRETWVRRRLQYELTPAGHAVADQETIDFGPEHD